MELVTSFLVFCAGGFIGFIVGIFVAARRDDDHDDFDGGFTADNKPPVRTIIWSDYVQHKKDKL